MTNNNTTINDNASDFDIFAPPSPVPEDQMAISLKREVEELLGLLDTMSQAAPTDDDHTVQVKEDWCERWKFCIDSLGTCLQRARETNVIIKFTDAQRKTGTSGNQTRKTILGQAAAIKAQVEKERADKERADKERAEKERAEKERAEKERADKERAEQERAEKERAEQERAEKERAEKGRADKEDVRVRKAQDAERTQQDDDEEDAQGDMVPSDADTDVVALGPRRSVTVVNRKKVACMSVKPRVPNAIPCDTCARLDRLCFPTDTGNVCADCKRLKAKCSLASEKSNPRPAATTSRPIPPKPRARRNAGKAPKASPVPIATRKGKEVTPAAGPSSERARPGPLSKRKYIEIEDDSESDDAGADSEDAYMAGRLNGLHTFVAVFETAFGALKEEVAGIDRYLGRKRRRRQ